jgi:hypothetical protein
VDTAQQTLPRGRDNSPERDPDHRNSGQAGSGAADATARRYSQNSGGGCRQERDMQPGYPIEE